jgi:hypothetical protein
LIYGGGKHENTGVQLFYGLRRESMNQLNKPAQFHTLLCIDSAIKFNILMDFIPLFKNVVLTLSMIRIWYMFVILQDYRQRNQHRSQLNEEFEVDWPQFSETQ